MVEVTKGFTEYGFTQINLTDASLDMNDLNLVTKGAFTLLAKAKNIEVEGGGHGH